MDENIRQTIHFLGGFFFIAVLELFGKTVLLQAAILGLLVAISLDFLSKRGVKNKTLERVLKFARRKNEDAHQFFGAMFFLLGVLFLALLFEEKAILGGLIVLSVGDAASTLVGKRFGKTRLTKKHSLEGTIGGIVSSMIVLSLVFPAPVAFASAFCGMLSELLGLEDNVTIPVTSAVTITLLFL